MNGAILLLMLTVGLTDVDEPSRPNLLLVVTDDQRFDALGAAGHPFLETPTMDRLAADGIVFQNAFVTTPICAASRASILTGRYEQTHGFTFGTPPISLAHAAASYPTLLREAGYRTGFIGKWGMRVEKGGRAPMWDVYRPMSPHPYLKPQPDGTTRHLTDLTADAAIEFLESSDRSEGPFCLSVSFNAPHAEDGDPLQYIFPAACASLYEDVDVPTPPLSASAFFEALPAFQRDSLSRVRWHWRFDDEEKRQRMTKGYWRMISGVDRALGRILDALEANGLADDTVVVFTSDNGYFLGERGFAGKWTIHEESIRVPLIVFDPRRSAGRREEMALNVDLAPTLLDLAGVAPPSGMEGESLVPLLRGEPSEWREDFLVEHRFDHEQIPKCEGVRGARYVYVRYYEQEPIFEELYDLETDPREANNLAADPSLVGTLARMRARCDALTR